MSYKQPGKAYKDYYFRNKQTDLRFRTNLSSIKIQVW